MHSYFSPEFFANNRTTLREKLASDAPIVVTANGVMQRAADEPLSFHQDSNFWYLTGLNGSELVLVMHGDSTYIIVPGLSTVREAFDGTHDLDAYAKRSGITEFVSEKEGWMRLRDQLRATKVVATPATPPPYLKSHGLHILPYRRRLIARLKRTAPEVKIHDIRSELASLRSVKQPEELHAIQRAIDITSETLQDIAKNTLNAVTHEFQIEASLSYGFRNRGAEGHAFSPIVGAGKHSTTLHYMDNNGPIGPEDLVVLDVGAEVEHYASDLTRTVSQTPITGRKAKVFKAVAAAQDYAFGLIKPGVISHDYEVAMEDFIGKKLLELGVIKKSSSEHIRRYFPHATSHFLGLDTHDVGDYRTPWQAGMVLACEPGIYIPEEGIGVRIEDNVVVTENGCKVLSKACPRALTSVQ